MYLSVFQPPQSVRLSDGILSKLIKSSLMLGSLNITGQLAKLQIHGFMFRYCDLVSLG